MAEFNLDIGKIMELIPHRYPLLMVDRIIDISENSIVGLKNITINEHIFAGHFPGHPVFPGVLIIEAMAQTAAVFVTHKLKINPNEKVVYFMSIEEAAFRKPVIPGDMLHLHIETIKNRGNIWKMQGEAKVAGARVANAVFSAMIVDK